MADRSLDMDQAAVLSEPRLCPLSPWVFSLGSPRYHNHSRWGQEVLQIGTESFHINKPVITRLET